MRPRKTRKREPYRGSRAFDQSCRCNGSCSWCRDNRLRAIRRAEESAADQLEEALEDECPKLPDNPVL